MSGLCKDFRVSTRASMHADGETARDITTGTSGELGAEWEGGGHERHVVVEYGLY